MDIEQTKWHKRRWIALAFLGISLLVISLDTTVVNLALPSISKELGVKLQRTAVDRRCQDMWTACLHRLWATRTG